MNLIQLDSDWQNQPLGLDVSILAAHPQVLPEAGDGPVEKPGLPLENTGGHI